jgi:hypothetical protein
VHAVQEPVGGGGSVLIRGNADEMSELERARGGETHGGSARRKQPARIDQDAPERPIIFRQQQDVFFAAFHCKLPADFDVTVFVM